MIHWVEHEDGEGRFRSQLFRNEENDERIVYADRSIPAFQECAEQYVEAFNTLSDSVIHEICEKLIAGAKEGGINEELELPILDNPLDI